MSELPPVSMETVEEGRPSASALDLIPLRALNQVTYCPRLYYLEYVDGVMQNNEYVEEGQLIHRRINAPELAQRCRKEGEVLHTRSVSLASERLGLVGKLDLVEEKEGEVYPVEYKRSAAPRDELGRPTYWDNDAVQLCGQAMLLEEFLGRHILQGILYYVGSRERVQVPLDEALRAKTREAMATVRRLAAQDVPPPPLPAELRHRCPGCSLVTICQPEETLYQLQRAPLTEDLPAGLTRVLPQSDEGAVLYLQEQGSSVCRRSEHLLVRKQEQELARVPIAQIRQVVIFGNVQVSTQALQTLAECEIPVIYLSLYGRFIAALMPAPKKNIALRQAQFRRFQDPGEALRLSRAVVRAKLANQRTLLMRWLRARAKEESAAGGDEEETGAVRGSEEPAAQELAELLRRVEQAQTMDFLLGLEGQGAALYFREFPRFLKAQPPGRGFDFHGRNRRPPRDPVNALLSFAYALLAKDCFSVLCTVGFDPYCGFYHGTGRHGRPSLALDLMEEFRAVIADSVVITLINNCILTPEDFLIWRDTCQLTDSGRKKFFRAYEQRKATQVTHPVFGYKMSYSRMLEVQARMLATYIRGESSNYVGFTVR